MRTCNSRILSPERHFVDCGLPATWCNPRWPDGVMCDLHKGIWAPFYPAGWYQVVEASDGKVVHAIAIVEGDKVMRYGDPALVFGLSDPLPARGFPVGKLRWRIRCKDFVRARVRTTKGIREFMVHECNGHWEPAGELGGNQTAEVEFTQQSKIPYCGCGEPLSCGRYRALFCAMCDKDTP